jgi:hypothetical protein
MSIMRRFSYVVSSFIKYSYKKYEFMQITKGILDKSGLVMIILSVIAKAIPTLTPFIIPYTSEARMLRVTRLYFVEL